MTSARRSARCCSTRSGRTWARGSAWCLPLHREGGPQIEPARWCELLGGARGLERCETDAVGCTGASAPGPGPRPAWNAAGARTGARSVFARDPRPLADNRRRWKVLLLALLHGRVR